ncbi:hypothetical protein DID77_03765 [Candidatus Marinamargulisbacteria bacterium SCGC AG-439-L15]|nr:hypothetical protein DID77_03765 [Candidatus Marinamargulisbacteria bacterium SCGC AG-439-L15]
MSKLKKMIAFVFTPILLTIVGEFILKDTVNQLPPLNGVGSILMILQSPGILMGVSLIVIGGLLWLVALSKFEMSFIYPFLSINYVAILVGSQLFLGEEVNLNRYVAMGLIIIGLIFISKSPYSEKSKE